jgi:hypothetical protein
MNEPLSYQDSPETRGTAPIQFFESDEVAPPVGTKATPRPTERPRELPPESPAAADFQFFAGDEASEAPAAQATTRPAGRERTVNDFPTPPVAPSASEPGQPGS